MDSLRVFTEACRHAQELYQCESPSRLVKRMSAESSDLRGRLDGIVHGWRASRGGAEGARSRRERRMLRAGGGIHLRAGRRHPVGMCADPLPSFQPASSSSVCKPLFCRPGNARCSVSFVPFYDECFDERTVTTVDQLTKYTLLYEQCANQPEREVRAMIGNIDAMIENPMCRVNVTGILPRGENITIERMHSSDAISGGECVDDDEMGKSDRSRDFAQQSAYSH